LAGNPRRAANRELFNHELEPVIVDQIRRTTNRNLALGDQCLTVESRIDTIAVFGIQINFLIHYIQARKRTIVKIIAK
jgi:hypothetical protein